MDIEVDMDIVAGTADIADTVDIAAEEHEGIAVAHEGSAAEHVVAAVTVVDTGK